MQKVVNGRFIIHWLRALRINNQPAIGNNVKRPQIQHVGLNKLE